ncbi:TPA: hypothetical protein HA246_01240 [Candidatus Woesearchaeota archaeon]|nr:hypothetical protein [Candidatus Woesearchaeota archaeon]
MSEVQVKEVVNEKSREEVLVSYRFNKDVKQLRDFYNDVKKNYDISTLDMFNLIHHEELFISTKIFNKNLSALETIAKYLHENIQLDFNEIAILLNRNVKTVWQAYDFAKKKMPEKLAAENTKYFFPVNVIAKRELSVLENIVLFLKKEYSLKLVKIAELLQRDVKTIWTINKRAERKLVEMSIQDGMQENAVKQQ